MRKTMFAPGILAAMLMTDAAAAAGAPAAPAADAPAPATPDTVLKFTLPNLDGEHSLDLTTLPAEVRLDLLKNAARDYLRNRVNSTYQRHQKDEKVVAWAAYDEASKADPLQTAVPKPEGERPADADLQGALDRAIADLVAGNVRKQSDTPRTRAKADPLIATITNAVVREVYDSRRANDPKYSFVAAKAEVGADGLAYLNRMIDAKVEAGADRTSLEKVRDTKYVNPAKVLLGLTESKATKDLPSIL